MEHIVILIIIMVVSGTLGGAANYASCEISADEKHPLLKRIVLGVAASFAVPLFLNMISSSIMDNAKQSPSLYLVFSGFCILAAFSSRAFLTSLSKKLIEKVDAIHEKQEDLENEIDPLLAKETEPEPNTKYINLDISVTSKQKNILKALDNPKYTRRYLSGISAEIGGGDTVSLVYELMELRDKGLIKSKKGTKLDLYWLTQLGREYIRSNQ